MARFDHYSRWLDVETDARPPDAFSLLRLDPEQFSDEELKSAHSRATFRVMAYLSGDDENLAREVLKELDAAYAELRDPSRRQRLIDRLKSAANAEPVDAEVVEAASFGPPSSAPPAAPIAPAPPAPAGDVARRPCPDCGESIALSARKCRFCGKIFDRALAFQQNKLTRPGEEDTLSVADVLVALLCWPVGCFVGLIALINGQTSKGLKLILIAGFAMFVVLLLSNVPPDR